MSVAILRPAGDGSSTSTYGAHGYGTHLGAGSCPRTVSSTGLASYVGEGALDESTLAWIGARTSDTNPNPGRLEFSWTAPPTGITISKVELHGWLRIASVGGSYWSADVACYGFVNPAGTRYAGTTRTLAAAGNINTNSVGPAGTFVKYSLGAWTANPATGVAWVLSDLLAGTFLAGVAADSPNIPNANGGSTHTFDVALLEIEVTHEFTSAMTEPVRVQLSHEVTLRRSRLSMVGLTLPPRFAHLEPLDDLWYGSGALATPGDVICPPSAVSPQALDLTDETAEHPLLATEVTYLLDSPGVEVQALHMRDQLCSLRWPMISELGVDPDDHGVLILDQGGGMVKNRNQVGHSRRPDGLYTARAASTTVAGLRYASYVRRGLLLEGGGGERGLLNNTFSQWGGGTPTSWGVNSTGGTAVQDTTDYLIDAAGLRSSAKLTNTGAGGIIHLGQNSTGWTSAHYGRVRCTFKASDASAPPQVLLRRSDGADFNFATGAWSVGWGGWTNPFSVGDRLDHDPAAPLADQIIEWQSPVFNTGGSYNLTLYFGYMVGASKVARLYRVDLIRSTVGWCPAWGLIPTVGAAITQAADVVTMDNSTAYRFLSEDRGTLELRVTPTVSHADLPNSTYLFVAVSYRLGTGTTNEYDGLWYFRTDASNGKWVYQRSIGGTTVAAEYAVSGADLLTAGTEYPLAIRWTGSKAELGLSARTMDLFVSGALRARATSGTPAASTVAAVVLLARDAAAAAAAFFPGWYSRLVVNTWCLTDTEILRHMSQA